MKILLQPMRHQLTTMLLLSLLPHAHASIWTKRDCTFDLVSTGFGPRAEPVAILKDVWNFPHCANACLETLDLHCLGLGFLPDQRECRLYNVFNASDVTEASPGLKYYKGCRARDCMFHLRAGAVESGGYFLDLEELGPPLPVFCDMDSDGGGWTVFQRRQDGSVDFYRDWTDYRDGFGDVMGEHWLGNAILHVLTRDKGRELRLELQAWDNSTAWAYYSAFAVADENANFQLTASGYSGTAGDMLIRNHGQQFTTQDRDNDLKPTNCAQDWTGAWWYKMCGSCNPNGLYGKPGDQGWGYLVWGDFKGLNTLKFFEMKLR